MEDGSINDPSSFGVQYSLPVSAGPQNSSVSFKLPTSPTDVSNPQFHELEPNAEVVASTGHHYHLLDVSQDECMYSSSHFIGN